MSYTYMAEQLRLIAATTEMLNAANLPDDEHHYIRVQLVTPSSGEGGPLVIGEWCDEIGPDSWYYSEVVDRKK